MSLKSKIESLLFVSNFPLTIKRICELADEKDDEVKKAIDELSQDYLGRKDTGLMLVKIGDKVQLATTKENSSYVQKFIKDETTGELTRASLETLTIIAYRGPVSRAELERIRGVNCAIILRNLMMRGLVEAKNIAEKMETHYIVTMDFMRYLGLHDISELPDYEKLNSAETLKNILETAKLPENT